MSLSDNALEVLRRRYLLKDEDGQVVESPAELFSRVASDIAQADQIYGVAGADLSRTTEQFYGIMSSLEFLPNSPTIMNAGRSLGQLSACFVLPVGDSMEEIFETIKQAAIIHKSGGGTGFSFSRLRPAGSVVSSTSGVASGPVSFMKVFNGATEQIKQGGTRRGANMAILRIDHPDILEFISCKDNLQDLTNFNISVGITDQFMSALANKETFQLIDPQTGGTYQSDGGDARLDAVDLFDNIVDHAWRTGEPGVVFLDRMNRGNPTSQFETIEATNPCGEQPLPPYDSCNLGSINVGRFVKEPLPSDFSLDKPMRAVDCDRLAHVIQVAVHFLDNVIDRNRYPIPQIETQTKGNRRIGLGVMGWADMLVQLGLPYDSKQAFDLGESLMSFIEEKSHEYSSELARTRGRFPNWEKSIYRERGVVMRNATLTTVAPTGTISIIAGCSSGIEPYYAIAFERNVMDGTRLVELNPYFEQLARREKFFTEELIDQIKKTRSIAAIETIPESIRRLFLTAADLSPSDHLRMQASFQKYCDSSVSKTINFAETASRDEVWQAFEQAYRLGCKGVTIYRDNSRPHQVLSSFSGSTVREPLVEKRPKILSGVTEKIRTGYGNLYVTINVHDGRPFELFAQIGKSGYTTMADTEAICRLVSMALRARVPVDDIMKQLRGIGGSSPVFTDGGKVASIPDAIAQVLHRHFGSDIPRLPAKISESTEICPECAQPMRFDAGCFSCQACGYSTC
ncbi:MAG: vitamin B12-dependent ribonucleotide reductase [Candidatus Zixiibacteriota bacterium]